MAGVRRERADHMLKTMIAEAEAINADPTMMHWVVRLTVFGSYLSDKTVLGDLDIGFELKGRWLSRGETRHALFDTFQAIHPPPASIRANFMERLFWPERVIVRRLKVGRSISMHDHSELDLLQCPTKLLYTFTPPTEHVQPSAATVDLTGGGIG